MNKRTNNTQKKFDPEPINEIVKAEVNYFLPQDSALKNNVKEAFRICMPDRPKANLMLQIARLLNVAESRIRPFLVAGDFMMAAAMTTDDYIDDYPERCGETALWKNIGPKSTVIVTDYMYALLFAIIKKYRPSANSPDFAPYQKSTDLLLDYFRVMGEAQFETTVSREYLAGYTLADYEKLATSKASLLFQFCSAVPAYFAHRHVREFENFGYRLGIIRQYISDIIDFEAVEGDTYKQGRRMEDYFSHQPNVVLLLTGRSPLLSKSEKRWFYEKWTNDIASSDKEKVTGKVLMLIKKSKAIIEAKKILRREKDKLYAALTKLPHQKFKNNISNWAFRNFSLGTLKNNA